MGAAEARRLTDEVKADAAALWAKLLQLYEARAWWALGYSSWAAYCATEFDMGQSHAYRMLDAARVVEALPESHSPIGESVARELVPVLRDEPERVPEVWDRAVEQHGPTPTAAQVREVVQTTNGDEPPPKYPKAKRSDVEALTNTLHHAVSAAANGPALADARTIRGVPLEAIQGWLADIQTARQLLQETRSTIRRYRPDAR